MESACSGSCVLYGLGRSRALRGCVGGNGIGATASATLGTIAPAGAATVTTRPASRPALTAGCLPGGLLGCALGA
ncbi:MAG: hypothetical protein QM633_15000, partial [Propionicimonas sp.]